MSKVEPRATLDAYLARHRPLTEEVTDWGAMRLRVTGYLNGELPPVALVTSVRCIVTKGHSVLVVRNPNSTHIWPGGRRIAGEQLIETAQREVLEETGWAIAAPRLLGFLHYRHLTPRPADYAHPYPDFLQVVYTARATTRSTGPRAPDEYEVESSFRAIDEVLDLGLSAGEKLFFESAYVSLLRPEEVERWYGRLQSDPLSWVIEANGQCIGHCRLHSLDKDNRFARYAIGIFNRTFWGKGFGTEATRLVLKHAFDELKLHRVDLRVLHYNERAIAAFKKCGFVEEGRERDSVQVAGEWHTDIRMSILEHEYEERRVPASG